MASGEHFHFLKGFQRHDVVIFGLCFRLTFSENDFSGGGGGVASPLFAKV